MVCLQKIVSSNYHFVCRSTNILYVELRENAGIFRLTYQLHSSSADCATELCKPSKDSASLRA